MGLSQGDVAVRFEMSQGALSEIEGSIRRPSLLQTLAIERVTDGEFTPEQWAKESVRSRRRRGAKKAAKPGKAA